MQKPKKRHVPLPTTHCELLAPGAGSAVPNDADRHQSTPRRMPRRSSPIATSDAPIGAPNRCVDHSAQERAREPYGIGRTAARSS